MTLPRVPVVLASVFLASALSNSRSQAAEAFFSEDGSKVVMTLSPRAPGLVAVDVETGEITKAPLPKELKDEFIDSVARGSEGEALFLAKDAVWVWKQDATPAVKRVCATAPVQGATDLFVVTEPDTTLTDSLFVSGTTEENANGRPELFGRKAGTKTFMPVFCRRVDGAQGGAFSDDGRFFFLSGGDLWEGGISAEEDAGMERVGVLVGARLAPLGILNTDESNSGSMWVNEVVPAGKWLYLRLRGHHLGALVRIPMPAKPLYTPDSEEQPTLQAQINAMKQALTKVEIVNEELEDVQGFCAMEAGTKLRTFHCGRVDDKGIAMLLTEGDAEPEIIGYLPIEEQ